MRIAVVGTSGSGKTTLAARLSRDLNLPHIELDAINWQPNWYGLAANEPEEFERRVDKATAGPDWIVAGSYTQVRRFVWGRAQHLIWLDYSRTVIMPRVMWRSLVRAIDRKPLWNGNREQWLTWLDPEHPIRWAWDTWAKRRAEYEGILLEPEFAHLTVHRLTKPSMVKGLAGRVGRP